MKGDFTRSTFKREKHYSSVRMQQGRVQLDADWNEQLDIQAHHEQTASRDVIGFCGVPLNKAGFSVKPIASNLAIGQGRYYVDGILCENEKDVKFTEQEDLPGASLPTQTGRYMAYMDVWQRHITALEDPHIREVALGGQDTATRTRIVWQVKLVRVGDLGTPVNCHSEPDPWLQTVTYSTGEMRARSKPSTSSTSPCIIPPAAGYRRLENQLYRVEIHKRGELGAATFKWSRDNGSIVTSWKDQKGNDLIVGSLGRDQVLSFANVEWAELTDDGRELRGEPGTLVKLTKAEDQVLTIAPTDSINLANFPINPKVRRWDSDGEIMVEVPATNEGWIPLGEDGVEVKFEAGYYNAGDYWLIPARTATGDVEWPHDGSKQPESQKPHGIQHHYCRLALMEFDGASWSHVSDCRQLFPPLTELTSLFYVSGDGQEAAQDSEGCLLPFPLVAGVAVGGKPIDQTPLRTAIVRFEIMKGTGTLGHTNLANEGSSCPIETGTDGLASCYWKLDDVDYSQQVKATLRDANDGPVGLPLFFNATLSAKERAISANSGLVHFQGLCRYQKMDEVITVPIEHHLEKIETPPAIVLAAAHGTEKTGSEEKELFMEDFGLYNFGRASVRFKAVDVDLKTFRILLEPPVSPSGEAFIPNELWLRWWAIPAQSKGIEEAKLALIAIDPKKLNIEELNIQYPFVVTVDDPDASGKVIDPHITFPGISNSFGLPMKEIGINTGVFKVKVELDAASTITFIDFVTGNIIRRYKPPEPMSSGEIKATYTYEFQGKKNTITATAQLHFPVIVTTSSSLTVSPNPVYLNDLVCFAVRVAPQPPTANDVFHGFQVTVTKPDGTTETIGPFTSDSKGTTSIQYTPTQVGTYTIQFKYPGETFNSTRDHYAPCSITLGPPNDGLFVLQKEGPVPVVRSELYTSPGLLVAMKAERISASLLLKKMETAQIKSVEDLAELDSAKIAEKLAVSIRIASELSACALSVKDLERIEDISRNWMKGLIAAGITSVKALAESKPEDIAKVLRVSNDEANTLITKAKTHT